MALESVYKDQPEEELSLEMGVSLGRRYLWVHVLKVKGTKVN